MKTNKYYLILFFGVMHLNTVKSQSLTPKFDSLKLIFLAKKYTDYSGHINIPLKVIFKNDSFLLFIESNDLYNLFKIEHNREVGFDGINKVLKSEDYIKLNESDSNNFSVKSLIPKKFLDTISVASQNKLINDNFEKIGRYNVIKPAIGLMKTEQIKLLSFIGGNIIITDCESGALIQISYLEWKERE